MAYRFRSASFAGARALCAGYPWILRSKTIASQSRRRIVEPPDLESSLMVWRCGSLAEPGRINSPGTMRKTNSGARAGGTCSAAEAAAIPYRAARAGMNCRADRVETLLEPVLGMTGCFSPIGTATGHLVVWAATMSQPTPGTCCTGANGMTLRLP
jgi:hypothetical protein